MAFKNFEKVNSESTQQYKDRFQRDFHKVMKVALNVIFSPTNKKIERIVQVKAKLMHLHTNFK